MNTRRSVCLEEKKNIGLRERARRKRAGSAVNVGARVYRRSAMSGVKKKGGNVLKIKRDRSRRSRGDSFGRCWWDKLKNVGGSMRIISR